MRALIWVVALTISCTSEPDDAPRGAPLSEACNDCLAASDAGGCGAAEAACAARPSCDNALLCALSNDCWTRPSGVDCPASCPEPAADDAPLFDALETCARAQCADACDFEP